MLRRGHGLLPLAVGVAVAAMTGQVRAQSSEETVAFMLFGERSSQLYDGSSLKPKISIGEEGGARVTTTEELIRRTSCEYSLKRDHQLQFSSGKKEVEREVLDFDFSKLVDVDINELTGAAFRGAKGLLCLTKFVGEALSPAGERDCMDEWILFIEPSSALKWRRAVAHFRSAFCKGRAF